MQPRFFPGLNPRDAQISNVERESKRARFSPVISYSLPMNLHNLSHHRKFRFDEIASGTANTSRWHPLAINLFETIFELECQSNYIQSLPENVVLQQTPSIQSLPGPVQDTIFIQDAMLQHTPGLVIQPNIYSPTSLCCIPEIN